jgi:hypothetical protein
MADEPLQTFKVSWSWGPELIKTVEVEAESVEDAREKAYEVLACDVKTAPAG